MRRTASTLVCITLALIAIGLVMITSASGESAAARLDKDEFFFLKRQLIWLPVAIVGGIIVFSFDYRKWKRFCVPAYIATIVLLGLVLIPQIGIEVNGSRRWLGLGIGGIRVQPSEFAKFTVVVVMAWWVSENARFIREVVNGWLIPLAWLGGIAGLIFIEPDFGTTMLLGVVGLGIMFVSGTRVPYLIITGVVGLAVISVFVAHDIERLERILAFIDPEKYWDQSHQLRQSLAAFSIGGPTGVGLGESIQKAAYLPEAHTDFILAIIAEELGMAGTGVVLLLFAGLAFCGMRISAYAPDLFGKLLAFGFTLLIVTQACINLGVVTGALPTKGIALPFISYGGSSLVMCVVFVAVLLNISRFAVVSEKADRSEIKDKAHNL